MNTNHVWPCALLALLLALSACSKRAEPKPKKVQLPAAQVQSDPKRLSCKEHQCYEDVCIYCHEELREKGRLWCKEHDRYEDRCWLCHADQQDKNRAYCEKHFLYVDECFMCKPELKDKGKPAAQAPTDTQRLMCKEHNVFEDECGICHPELAATVQMGSGLKVRFGSPEAAKKAGVETAPARVSVTTHGVECYAEIEFDQKKLAQISSPVGGVVQSVEVDLGSNVEERTVLATIRSAAIGEAVARAILAEQTLAREKKLRAERISSEKEVQEAEAAYRAAYQQLKTLGFDDEKVASLSQKPTDAVLLELRAPFAGEIIQINAVRGALTEEGKSLFTLADRSTMWAMLNIPEVAVGRVRVGQKVELRVESLPEKTFVGTLTWIAAEVDERTRMARARAEFSNPDGLLRAKMFAAARILTDTHEEKSVAVPQSAIQLLDGRPFAFIELSRDLYEARPVVMGQKDDGQVEILRGIRPDDRVVVARSFLLKSQLLISRLGAGCVDH